MDSLEFIISSTFCPSVLFSEGCLLSHCQWCCPRNPGPPAQLPPLNTPLKHSPALEPPTPAPSHGGRLH